MRRPHGEEAHSRQRACASARNASRNGLMTRDGTTSPSSPAPAAPAAIEVADLVKVYKATRAVDGVSFRIASGSITGLLGGNGAGKTTTIAMIMGLVLPTSGR